MFTQVRAQEVPSILHNFTGIRYLRSLLGPYSARQGVRAWIDTDGDLYALQLGFIAYIDSDPDYLFIQDLLNKFPESCYIINRQDKNNHLWKEVLNKRWNVVNPQLRNSFSSENLHVEHIQSQQPKVPSGYLLRQLDEESDMKYFDQEMSRTVLMTIGSLTGLLTKATHYGVIDVGKDILASLCSGYPFLGNEDEIDILTRNQKKYRRKGLGSIAARALMIHSLRNKRVPVWDAANDRSKYMALKLGFTNPKSYYTYMCDNQIFT